MDLVTAMDSHFENKSFSDEHLWLRILKIAGIIVIAGLFMIACAYAEERTLFNSEGMSHGGFGGPQVLWTEFNGEDGLLVGGHGAWVVNKTFYLGGAGYGLVSEHAGPEVPNYTETPELRMGYGGMLIGFILSNDRVVHTTADVLIGGGGINNNIGEEKEFYHDPNVYRSSTDAFWMVQPMAHIEVNITDWMRLDISGGYRYVENIDSFGLKNDDVSGPVAGLTLRFGSWGGFDF
jgi:hypothetical protein